MAWLGSQLGNAALSAGMYGAFGYMTYDSSYTDPLNQATKMTMGLGTDLAVDAAILGGGGAASALWKKGTEIYGSRYGTPQGALHNSFNGPYPDKITPTNRKFSPKSLKGKMGNHFMRHLGGYGLAAHMALGFMGVDPASIVMSAYDSAESTYREARSKKQRVLTDTSARYMQDQLHKLRNSGNEAEFLHN